MRTSAHELTKRLIRLEELATVGDRLSAVRNPPAYLSRELTDDRVRSFYELAYLRACYTWEWFLEDSFIESLARNPVNPCGGTPRQAPFRNASQARDALFSNSIYVSWSNIPRAVQALSRLVDSGIHEQVLLSYRSRLEAYLNIRHHIAHDSKGSRQKFDEATQLLNSKIYREGPGDFLRDRDRNQAEPVRWFRSITDDFKSLAVQIAPN